jgi:hypothetical protein
MAGFAGTLSVTVPVTDESLAEVAVIVTVKAVATGDGAVYVTELELWFDSAPQAEPLQPLPVSVHVKPSVPLCSTVAVRVIESPGSIVLEAGVLMVTVGLLLPPQPVSPVSTATRRRDKVRQEDRVRRFTAGLRRRAKTDGFEYSAKL